MPNLSLKDGSGASLAFTSYPDSAGNPTLGHTPLVGGSPVASANPLPVAPSVAGSAVSAANPLPVAVRGVAATYAMTVVVLAAGVATQVAASNANRRALAVANIGTGAASMGFANTVAAGAGWPLAAAASAGEQGGGYEWPSAAVHTGAVWVISAAGTTLAVLEG